MQQRIICLDKSEKIYPIPPPIKFTEVVDFKEYDYTEKGKYISLISSNVARRQMIFMTSYWDQSYTKLRWLGEDDTKSYDSVLAINIPYDKSYCHNIIDTLPLILELETLSNYDLIVIPSTPFLQKFKEEMKFNLKKVLIMEGDLSFKTKKLRIDNYCMRSRCIKRLRRLKKIFRKI